MEDSSDDPSDGMVFILHQEAGTEVCLQWIAGCCVLRLKQFFGNP